MAVESCSLMLLIAFATVPCCRVGGTRIDVAPAIETTETLYFSGSALTNAMAAALAASSRFGATSVACIDSEASMTSTIVARSRGTFTSVVGWAKAVVSVTRLSSDSATARWRRHCDWRGMTTSSIEVFVKRMPRRFLRRLASTYAATSSGTTTRISIRVGAAKLELAEERPDVAEDVERGHRVTPCGGACSMLATRR